MHPLAGARARAYLVDCLLYLGIAACEVPVGLVGRRRGWDRNRRYVYAASAVAPLTAALLAALAEAGPRQATRGKRREGLTVVQVSPGDASQRVGFARSLVRNVVKIAVPWQMGHVVALGASSGGFDRRDRVTLGTTVLVYPLLGAMAWTGLRGGGRPPHDRVAGTRVVRA
ncbi:MAG: RDD family protein [Micrococcales bacterium]|nr:RDD family protein [Micrococcales bacterium]